MRVILQTWCQIQRTSSSLRYVNRGPGHIQSTCSSGYSDFNIHVNVSALLLYIQRQFNARYTANLVPNTAYIVQFTLCGLWPRTYTKNLQLRIFMLHYSAAGICCCYCRYHDNSMLVIPKNSAKYSAHPPVYAMWTVVPAIYKVLIAPHIQISIFI
jgi:hypothetical protein